MRLTLLTALTLRLTVFAALLFGSALAQAGTAERTPQAIKPGEILRGNFVQDRKLAGFAKPLRTEGTFALIPGQGLIWQALTPFKNTVVISPGGLLALADGKESMRLDAARMPGLGRLYDVLGGAVSGDLSVLKQAFAVNRTDTANSWQLLLTPLKADSMAASQIKSLTVTGRRFVDTIEIAKEGNDVDVMTFLNQTAATASPSAEEKSLLQALHK
ncbi:MAG: outer membrane lipoprotein carrier protein LolA [Alphaproteobacteria bacterium]|nr:outer membrane lipoprotein carrier protein LolA [Alphaproteobacteria bacterium]